MTPSLKRDVLENHWKLSFDVIGTHSRNRGPSHILSFGKALVVLTLSNAVWNKLLQGL